MNVYFCYDSRDHQQPFTRLGRFLLFLLTLACLVFAAYLAYHYFTDWSADEHSSSSRVWLFLAIGLFFCGLASLAFIATKWFKAGYKTYQYLCLDEQKLSWRFGEGAIQELNLDHIQSYSEDPRHLILHCQGGETVWIENYLLPKPEQWAIFMQAAEQQLPARIS